MIFERIVLSDIFMVIILKHGQYQTSIANEEVYTSYIKNIKALIRSNRVKWIGHTWRNGGIRKLTGRVEGRRLIEATSDNDTLKNEKCSEETRIEE